MESLKSSVSRGREGSDYHGRTPRNPRTNPTLERGKATKKLFLITCKWRCPTSINVVPPRTTYFLSPLLFLFCRRSALRLPIFFFIFTLDGLGLSWAFDGPIRSLKNGSSDLNILLFTTLLLATTSSLLLSQLIHYSSFLPQKLIIYCEFVI